MSQFDKLLLRIYMLDKNLRFEELRKVLEYYGYSMKGPASGSSHKTFRKKVGFHLLLFWFVQFEINCRNILDFHFNDWKAIWQFNFFWQFEIISTTVFCFLKHINISIVCFNNLHELVLKFVCSFHAFTQWIQTLCKIVHLLVNRHCFFKMSVFFNLEREFIDFCVSSFWHFV